MEMQEVPKEEANDGYEAASEPKQEGKIEEEPETDLYAKLHSPAEDVYEDTRGASKKRRAGKQTLGNVSLYRAACFILALLCLALLLVVILLGVKLQTGSNVCPENAPDGKTGPSFRSQCNYKQCQNHFAHPRRCRCQQCAPGWKQFESSCFYFSTSRLSWDESLQNCSSQGGSLAIVSSQEVQTFLTKEGNMVYWIGLKKSGSMWTWVNQTVLQTSHWSDQQQQHGDCGILNSKEAPEKSWFSASCDAATFFICQIEL